MNNLDTYSISGRKQRWTDFLSMDKPSRHLFLIHFDEEDLPATVFCPNKKNERIEWAWKVYNKQMEHLHWLDDDRVPCLNGLSVFTGTEIFAQAFGCKVHCPDNNMPFALPKVHNATEAAAVKVPDWSSTPLTDLFDMADELRRRAGKDTVLKLPDIQSPMDIAALIWDKNDFYIAMIDEPEAVKELALKVRQLLTSFLDAWFDRYGKSFIAHHPDYYMSYGITLSEDEVGIVNQDMFREFFLPELVELSNHFGAIGIHCCATADHQWANFKSVPALKLLNLNPPVEKRGEAYKFFAKNTAQWHYFAVDSTTNIPLALNSIPENARIVIDVNAASKDEAMSLSEKLKRALGRD